MKTTVSTRTYYFVCATLLILVALTAGLAFVNLGPFNGPVAVGIAAVKGILILLFFMHIRISSGQIRLASVLGFTWLAILFALALSDYISRGALQIPGK